MISGSYIKQGCIVWNFCFYNSFQKAVLRILFIFERMPTFTIITSYKVQDLYWFKWNYLIESGYESAVVNSDCI